MGQMTVKEAKKYESSLYGDNFMIRYHTEDEYNKAIELLKESGEKVNE